jgi:hypothetical protein
MATSTTPPSPPATWRNRITRSGGEAPDQLLANPSNWRIHPKAQQDAPAGALDAVGWVQQVLVNRRSGFVVDGHARVALALSETIRDPFADCYGDRHGSSRASPARAVDALWISTRSPITYPGAWPLRQEGMGQVNALLVGSILFAVGGVIDALIGALTWVFTRVGDPPPDNTFVLNPRADLVLFGDTPRQLAASDQTVAVLYHLTFDLIGGLLFAFGVLQTSVAWFALRQGQAWALWVLVVADLIFIAGWGLVISRYAAAGAPLIGGTVLPPNLFVPLVLLIPAAVLAYIGLQSPASA